MSPDKNCFRVLTSAATYDASLTACTQAAPGASLAKIASTQDAEFVEEMCYNMGVSKCWIGLRRTASCTVFSGCSNDATCTCAFRWQDGTAMPYNRWIPGKPSTNTFGCVANHIPGWSDAACTDRNLPVCQGRPPLQMCRFSR